MIYREEGRERERTEHRLFKTDFIYLFLEKGERREKERERNMDVTEKRRSGGLWYGLPPGTTELQPRHVP